MDMYCVVCFSSIFKIVLLILGKMEVQLRAMGNMINSSSQAFPFACMFLFEATIREFIYTLSIY